MNTSTQLQRLIGLLGQKHTRNGLLTFLYMPQVLLELQEWQPLLHITTITLSQLPHINRHNWLSDIGTVGHLAS